MEGVLTLDEVSADDARATALLTEYFGMRAESFPGGAYRTTFPDPALFVPPAGVFVVASSDGSDVGCGGIRRLADSAAGVRYEVKNVYLRPESRGRGWGHELMQGLEDRARAFGAVELVLDTHHSLAAAGALYARQGFEQVEAYNDNANATRWYRKALV